MKEFIRAIVFMIALTSGIVFLLMSGAGIKDYVDGQIQTRINRALSRVDYEAVPSIIKQVNTNSKNVGQLSSNDKTIAEELNKLVESMNPKKKKK